MDPAKLGELLYAALEAHRPAAYSERALCDGIERAILGLGLTFEREFALNGRDRPDFMVGRAPVIAIEVKIKGSLAELMRQVARYAEAPDVSGILVLTTRSAHGGLPPTLGGKPVAVKLLSPLYL